LPTVCGIGIRRLRAEEILRLIAAKVDDYLLEDDAGMAGRERQLVEVLPTDGDGDGLLHHTTGHGRIELAVHIGLAVYQRLIEVDNLRLGVVKADGVLVTTDIEEVEGALDHHMHRDRIKG